MSKDPSCSLSLPRGYWFPLWVTPTYHAFRVSMVLVALLLCYPLLVILVHFVPHLCMHDIPSLIVLCFVRCCHIMSLSYASYPPGGASGFDILSAMIHHVYCHNHQDVLSLEPDRLARTAVTALNNAGRHLKSSFTGALG